MNGSTDPSDTLWARTVKRWFDFAAAAALLIVLSPLLLGIALLVKLTTPGPVFFTQQRGGWRGRPFRLVKFRTMHADRRPDPKELVPLSHPEITWVGRILRRSKLDELPQLWNVLRGDMSLVGPRPTLLDQVEAYDVFRRQRLLVRPGITGLAQVYGNSLVSWDERILYDIAYVRLCSFSLDVWILVRTAWVIMAGEKNTTREFASTRFKTAVSPPPGYGS
jgi:lipopolysaccharide/colanic/teichoic acid biosynthesis glycosyltransferase